jgi:hypothetical protein
VTEAKHADTRNDAMEELTKRWPDETTRALLAQRAVQNDVSYERSNALEALAQRWPDGTTRALLEERAVQDDDPGVRLAAIRALAEVWPDEAMRELLTRWATEAPQSDVRSCALRATAATWPDGATRDLLKNRVVQDLDDKARGAAFSALAGMHSEFGRILPRLYLNDGGPDLDPLQPIPRDRIEKAAEMTGIRPDDINAQVASLSAHLGWDVTRGAKPSGEE